MEVTKCGEEFGGQGEGQPQAGQEGHEQDDQPSGVQMEELR